ncbi:MAG: ABC transporter permease [Candidatus Aenigmarchaeota archaeon]|nr:ABC transporter permease [Candidatus Aenigmarchaeota archaeon]
MNKKKIIVPVVVLLAVLAAWEMVTRLANVPIYILPPPSHVAKAFFDPRTQLLKHTYVTLGESVCGLLIGSMIGLSLGVILAESQSARLAFLPYIVGSNAVPVIAIAPLVVMWFGYGFLSRVLVSAFLCFFPLCINAYRGLQAADTHFRELFDVYGATRSQYLLKARLPYAMPFLFAGGKLNATYAVIGAVVAEFIGTTAGLGYGMVHASYNLDTPRLWAYLVVSITMGISFYSIVWILEFWYRRRYE